MKPTTPSGPTVLLGNGLHVPNQAGERSTTQQSHKGQLLKSRGFQRFRGKFPKIQFRCFERLFPFFGGGIGRWWNPMIFFCKITEKKGRKFIPLIYHKNSPCQLGPIVCYRSHQTKGTIAFTPLSAVSNLKGRNACRFETQKTITQIWHEKLEEFVSPFFGFGFETQRCATNFWRVNIQQPSGNSVEKKKWINTKRWIAKSVAHGHSINHQSAILWDPTLEYSQYNRSCK